MKIGVNLDRVDIVLAGDDWEKAAARAQFEIDAFTDQDSTAPGAWHVSCDGQMNINGIRVRARYDA